MTTDFAHIARRHLKLGWWGLLAYLSLGLALEGLHGFKIGWYLDVGQETRRHMWVLAHTHGTLLSLVQIVFGLCVAAGRVALAGPWPSRLLIAAWLLMPLGFFLGGVVFYGGDPGLGILLVPLGGLCLFLGVLLTARSVS